MGKEGERVESKGREARGEVEERYLWTIHVSTVISQQGKYDFLRRRGAELARSRILQSKRVQIRSGRVWY